MNNLIEITRNLESNYQFKIKKASNLDDLETITVQMIRRILQEWLENSEAIQPEPKTRCSGCGKFANYISKRVGFIHSQFGLLRYRRAYYVCPHCHQSTCPMDERLDPVESLARLRAKIADGKQLPVADIAKDWGLGSLQKPPVNLSNYSQMTDTCSRRIRTNLPRVRVGSVPRDLVHLGMIS